MKKSTVVLFALTLLVATFAGADTAPQGTIALESTSPQFVMVSESLDAQATTVELEPFWAPSFLSVLGLNRECTNPDACTFDRDCFPGTCINPTGLACAGTCC